MKTIHIDQTNGVRTITLNRPEVRNAMSLEMVTELGAALEQAEGDETVRVLVLRGAGGHFCSGGDLQDMVQARMRAAGGDAGQSADGLDVFAQVNAQFGRLCLAYARTTLPVITVLEGAVMGGGFGLACVSDVTLAHANTVFRLPETSLGVIPAQIAPFLLERIGYAEAKRLAVSGGKIEVAEALQIRLVHEVHPTHEELATALGKAIARIMACAPGAIAATKQLLARARFEAPHALINDAAVLFSNALQGPEGQEGTAAFMQKRKPAWMPQEG